MTPVVKSHHHKISCKHDLPLMLLSLDHLAGRVCQVSANHTVSTFLSLPQSLNATHSYGPLMWQKLGSHSLGGEYLYKLHENFNKRCVTSTPFACSIVCLFILTWTRDFAFYCLSYDLILHFITHIFPVLATRSFSSCFMFPLDIPPSLYLFLAFFLSSTMICLRITLYSPPF